MSPSQTIQQAAKWIAQADGFLFMAGAGMGVDSGLPDFRGNSGFWREYPAVAKLGVSFEEMANPSWFSVDPYLAWAFYGHRFNLYHNTQPHAGFARLLQWAADKNDNYFVFTSNVDGQFQQAGFNEQCIYEVHGSISHWQCSRPCIDDIWPAPVNRVLVDTNRFIAIDPMPTCPHCGKIARPNILMFGDFGWLSDRSMEQSLRMHSWLEAQAQKRIVILEFGAGRAVPTVRFEAQRHARNSNFKLIRINPRDYEVPGGHLSLAMGALEAIEAIHNALQELTPQN